jgi:hypothetical protein
VYSRIITCKIDPSRIEEFRAALNIEALDTATGEYCCTTLWNSKADIQNYDDGLFKEIAAALAPVMIEAPTVRTLPVENSSVHKVAAGKAA